MKKTAAQPQIRPQKKIKIPQQLIRIQKKAINEHNFFSSLQQPPIITKKELLFEAMGIETSSRRRAESRKEPTITLQPKKNVQIQVVKQFQIYSEQKTIKRSQSVQKFKIKMTGAGFRKRGKSVANMRNIPQQKKGKASIKPQTSQQLLKSKAEQQQQSLNIIKAYYSAKIQREIQSRIEQKKKNKLESNYKSENLIKKQDEQSNQPKQMNIRSQMSKQRVPSVFNKIMPVNFETLKTEVQIKKIMQQAFKMQDMEQQQSDQTKLQQKFSLKGFGVNHDLSKYDIQSLDDPNGTQFLKKYLNIKAQCPYFQNDKYKWMKVVVVGFDPKCNKVIINKQGQNKQRKVSRLSLKFQNEIKQYWVRINEAKALRSNIMQQIKYAGYIDGRPEKSDIFELVLSDQLKNINKNEPEQMENLKKQSLIGRLPQHKQKIIENQCHNHYYKQFLVYFEMFKNFQPFKQLGIQFRQFIPAKLKKPIPRFADYDEKKKMLQTYHYCSVKNMGSTLRAIIKKIGQETKYSFFGQIIQENRCVNIDIFMKNCLEAATLATTRFIKQTRQVLVSQIIHQTRYSFGAQQRPVLKVFKGNNKQLQKRYFRLCNYMFHTQIQQEYFLKNCNTLSKYLSDFSTWSKNRVDPFLNLEVRIKQKQFECSPSKQQVYDKLYKIYSHIKSNVNKIPDLTSDLLYEKQHYIHVELNQHFGQQLMRVINYSYLQIEQYIQCNQVYLRYLSNIGFTKGNFDRETVKKYEIILGQIVMDLKKTLHQSLYTSGIFKVSLTPCKQTLSDHIQSNKSRILRQIQKQCLQQNQVMLKQLKKMTEELKNIPDEELSYRNMKNYVHVDCQNLIDQCRDKYQICTMFYQLLEKFTYPYRIKESESFMESVAEIAVVQKRVATKKYELQEIQKKLIEKINIERQEIQKVVQEAKIQIQVIVGFKKLEDYKQSFSQTSKLYFLLQQNRKKLQNINYRQELLLQEPSTFPWLGRLCRRLLPFFQMWKNIYYYMIDSQDWYELPVQELHFEQIKHKVNQIYKKQFGRLGKHFNEARNTDAFMICEAGNQLVKKIQEKFWLIDSFTKEGLLKKPIMMSSILTKIYGPEAPTNFRNVNLNDLLKNNAQINKQFIVQTSTRAQKIWNLQKRVNAVISQIKNLYFQLVEKHNLTYIEPDLILTLLSATRQQLSVMDIIKSQDQAIDIIKRITTVHNKIQTIADTLSVIEKFQYQFVKLYRVFLISEVINELSDQKRKINEVHRGWNAVTKHFSKDLQLWEAIDSDSHKYRLQSCMKTLKQVQQALKKWLHNKRKIFPRLFFITDDQLMQMISNQKFSIQTAYLKYLYHGSVRLIIKEDDSSKKSQIIGIEGLFGDFIKFKRSINSSIIVWDKLNIIRQEMIDGLKADCTPIGLTNSNLLMIKLYSKVMKWTLKIEQCMRSSDKEKNNLKKLSEIYYKQQIDTFVPSFRKGQTSKLHSFYALKSLTIILHQQLKTLSKFPQSLTPTSFQYQKLTRIYLASDKVQIKIMSFVLPLGYEYVGCDSMDIISMMGSPRKNIHSILTLMRMFMGANGKNSLNAVKQIAALSLNHFVEFMVNKDVNQGIGLANALRGFYIEPIFGCLHTKQDQVMSIQSLSLLAEVAYQIKQALISKQYITVLGIETKWDLNKSFFNYCLHLDINTARNAQCLDYHFSTLKLCFRTINFLPIPWSKLSLYLFQSFCHPLQKFQHLFLLISQLVANSSLGFQFCYTNLLNLVLRSQIKSQLQNSEENIMTQDKLINLFIGQIQKYIPWATYVEFKKKSVSLLQQLSESEVKKDKQIDVKLKLIDLQVQVRQLSQMLSIQAQKSCRIEDPKMVVVVGPALSGKTYLIKQTLSHIQTQKQDIVESPNLKSFMNSNVQQIPKYLLLHQLYSCMSFTNLTQTNLVNFYKLYPDTIIIYQTLSLEQIGPNPLAIYNKKINSNWHKILWPLLKSNLSSHSAVLEECSRQMGIFVRSVLYGLIGCSGQGHLAEAWMWEKQKVQVIKGCDNPIEEYWKLEYIFIRIIRSCIKVVTALIKQGRIVESDLSSIRQAIFLTLIWTTKQDIRVLVDIALNRQNNGKRQKLTQYALLSLNSNIYDNQMHFWYFYLQNIESSLVVKNSLTDNSQVAPVVQKNKKYQSLPNLYDMCYDIEKKAWIQWNVVDQINHYFKKSYDYFEDIYLPIKQTAAALYFGQYLARHEDFWLISEHSGSGTSTIIKKILFSIANPIIKAKKLVTQSNNNDSTIKNDQATPKAAKFIMNQNFSFVSCSKQTINAMIGKIYTSRNKDGSFNPYRNGHLQILIDDMSMVSQKQEININLMALLSMLNSERMAIDSIRKLNNMRLIFISTGYEYMSQCLPHTKKIKNNSVSLQMREISNESKQTIFSYILDWFFGNTDNPFSKQVRSMKQLIVGLTLSLSNQYEKYQSSNLQVQNNEEQMELIKKWRTGKSNLKMLKLAYGFICQTNPRKVKRQKDILSIWVYQFNRIFSNIPGIQYLKNYESLNLKKSPIQSKEFLKTISQIIFKDDSVQSSSHSLKYHNQWKIMYTKKTNEYNMYTYQEAQVIIAKTLLQLQHADKIYDKNLSLQNIIFYPQFVREIIDDLRLLTGSCRTLMKVSQPFTGCRTVLKFAVMIATGHLNIGFIQENSKSGWKIDLIKFLGKTFYMSFDAAPRQNTDLKPFVLTFKINKINTLGQYYVKNVLQYLQNSQSRSMLYNEDQNSEQQQNVDQERQPRTLLQSLNIYSSYSDKFKRFLHLCKNYLKFAVIVQSSNYDQIVKKYPSFLTQCQIININRNSNSHQIQSILNNSIGYMWSQQSLIQFLENPNKEQLLNQNINSRKILKSIKNLQHQQLCQMNFVWGNRKYRFIQWMKWTMKYYRMIKNKLDKRISDIKEQLQKKQSVQEDKGKLQKQLALLIPKLDKIRQKNQVIFVQVRQLEGEYLAKKKIYDDEEIKVNLKKQKTIEIQNQCQHELGKVTPILQSAQQSLAKVTRDDINQLRSFPSPPLPAAKVVQALCFVFNQDHLVKEKVQNGNKFKDYWDYAKKFILNDRLLKRVTEFKPDYIKTMNKNKMQILKVIIRQPELKQQRVFKASSAAGNLSVWMRAVVLTFEVMQVIDPKRKQLNEALEALKAAEQILSQMKTQMDTAFSIFQKKLSHYNHELIEQQQLQNKIQHLKAVIKRSQQFLVLLSRMEVNWRQQIDEKIPKMFENGKNEAVWMGLYVGISCSLSQSQRNKIKERLAQSLGNSPLILSQQNMVNDYQKIFLYSESQSSNVQKPVQQNEIQNNIENQNGIQQNNRIYKKISKRVYNIVNQSYVQSLVSFVQHLRNTTNNLIIVDPTQTFVSVVERQLNENKLKYQIVDCLNLDNENLIYEKVKKQLPNQIDQEQIVKERILIILNLQQFSICQQFVKDSQTSQLNTRLIIIIQNNFYKHSNFTIINSLTNQIKQSMIFSLLCPIDRENTALSTKLMKYQRQQSINSFDMRMSSILLNTPNILLNDQAIKEWINSYERYWQAIAKEVNIKDNTVGEREVVKGISSSQYWEPFTEFNDFLEVLSKSQKDPIFTLNQRLRQKFQTDLKKKQNQRKITINSLQQNQLKTSQIPILQQQETLPFSPIQFIQLSQSEDGNQIIEFIQSKKSKKPIDNTNVLSSSQHVFFFPSHQKALQNLPFLTENQKQMVICCNTKFEAYKMYNQILSFYDKFCKKMEDADDQFTAESYGFRAYIIVTGEQDVMKNRKWRVIKHNYPRLQANNKKSDEYFMKQLQKFSSAAVKAERQYCQQKLTQRKTYYNSYSEFNCDINDKNQALKQWESLHYSQ